MYLKNGGVFCSGLNVLQKILSLSMILINDFQFTDNNLTLHVLALSHYDGAKQLKAWS